MESWNFSCAESQAVPSSCSFPVLSSSLTAVANGSRFLYFIDFKQRKKYAIVRFSSAVLHVGKMTSVDNEAASVATCCLGDGRIAVVSISNIVTQLHKQSEDKRESATSPLSSEDILSSLFDDPLTPLPSRPSKRKGLKFVLSENKVAVAIGHVPSSEWTLVSAVICNDILAVCRKSKSTGEVSLAFLKSSVGAVISSGGSGTITVPSFVLARPLQTVEIVSADGVLENTDEGIFFGKDCKLVFFSISCSKVPPGGLLRGHSGGPCMKFDATITSELFSNLFGADFILVKSHVFLIGCQNGNIYYTDFCENRPQGRGGSEEGEGFGRAREGDLLSPLYSLEDPVVGIHSAYFPTHKDTPETPASSFRIQNEAELDDKNADNIHNTLIFIGQSGKIVISYCPSSTSDHNFRNKRPSFLNFLEYHVPSPILSSSLISNQCLLYTTPGGVYRICLRPQCAETLDEKLPTIVSKLSLRIPVVSFRFPEKICDYGCGLHLLELSPDELCENGVGHGNTGHGESGSGQRKHSSGHGETSLGQRRSSCSDAKLGRDSLCCLCLSLDGHLFTFHFDAQNSEDSRCKKDSTLVGQEIKLNLQSIQTQEEKVECLTKQIHSLNSILAELKSALDVLCAVKEASSSSASSPLPTSLPLTCSFAATREDAGSQIEELFVVVELKLRSSASVLRNGWYFIVTSYSLTGHPTASKSVSLCGMSPGTSITVKVGVAVGGWSLCGDSGGGVMIECWVHYNPQHLLKSLPGKESSGVNLKLFKSVSLLLERKEFSVLDFLSTQKLGSTATSLVLRETLSTHQAKMVKSILSSSPLSPQHQMFRLPTHASMSLPHSAKLTLQLSPAFSRAVQSFITPHPLSSGPARQLDNYEVATGLLKALIPGATGVKKSPMSRGGAGEGGSVEACMGFDGGVLQVTVDSLKDSQNKPILSLEVRVSCWTALVAAVGAIGRRLLAIVPVGHTSSTLPADCHRTVSDEACVKLEHLNQVLQDVAKLEREVGGAYQKRRSKSMSVEAYWKTMDTSRTKALSIYCLLRELML